MALQGTIETFALPDVLRLLATTSKTGRLHLSGDRGEGSVWLASGKLVGGETSASAATSSTDVMFELLRFIDGDFAFHQDEEHGESSDAEDVEDVLGSAESMLEEWTTLEAVVPSLAGWITLASELPGDEITVTAEVWSSVVLVGGGTRVSDLAAALELGDLAAMRCVRDLLEIGVVSLGEAPADAPVTAPAPEPEPFEPIAVDEPTDAAPLSVVPEVDAPADGDLGFEPFDMGDLVIEDVAPLPESSLLADLPADEPVVAPAPAASGAPPADATEIARQLANLSPKAAKAVAAAAKATTDEEREAALEALDDEDTSLNRDLLLKFLGSVNS